MLELSLHILDILENATRAGASEIHLAIILNKDRQLRIQIDDNGPGLAIPNENLLDPFYTTKQEKKTGLGLSLFKAAAEQANGCLAVERSDLGGLCVKADMECDHIDRQPLGDFPATLYGLLLTNPEVALSCAIESPEERILLESKTLPQQYPEQSDLVRARHYAQALRKALAPLHL